MTDKEKKETEEVVPETMISLTKDEAKQLNRFRKQLQLQQSDLIIKLHQVEQAIAEVNLMLQTVNKAFKS